MSREDVERIRAGFAEWQALAATGDTEGFRRMLEQDYHPDVEVDFGGLVPDLPPTKGREALLRWAEGTVGALEDVRYEADEFIDGGDVVLVPTRLTTRGGVSGVETTMRFVYVFHLDEGGRCVALRTYRTLADAREAVGQAG